MEICLLGLLVWCFHLEILWAARILQHQRSAPPKVRTPKTKDWMSSSSSSSASTFTWLPTPNLEKADPQESEAAVAFLYSGDVMSLSQANCTQSFEVRDMGKASGPAPALRSSLRGATDTLTHATNFLNMVFQTNDIRESSVKEDVEWYHALVRSVIEGDPQVYRAVLTFDAHPVSSKPQLMLQATKENNQILLKDLSASAENLRNLTWENEWYNFFWFQKTPILSKRILYNDLKTLDTPKWSQGDSYVMSTSHVRWSPPFLECEDGKFLPNWMITLSSSFYGLKPDLNPEFKGVVRMDVKIQNVDINQCATGQGWFANTHQCDLNSTQCIPQENQGFVLGRYVCLCKPGFYGISKASPFPSTTNNDQSEEDASQYGIVDSGNLLECHPCQEGCSTCIDGTPCLVREDWSLRAAVLAFQAFCMLAVFFSMLVSYHFRKSKRIRASGVVLLETILFGSLLLYFPVFILYFKPSIFRCIVLRWVRMLGFAIVYGTITLKLYRVLKIFLSRTAQRVPYMSSGRVLKMLALILLLVLWFLAAWTVGVLENIEKNIPLVVLSQTTRGLQFYICDHDRWDYMMVVAEMLFLLWGSFLCYATRTIPSAFHEPRYMGVALHNELITSTAFHFVRFFMVPSLHPDWTLLLFFVHTHVTTTMTLALLFIPKFLHAGSPLQEEIAAEVYEDELDLKRSGSCLNSSLTSAWSEHSLDPDDIRDELKKLYIQLEVNKTKKMAANNPHLQKKRSSKRGLGRSLMRRITEIPESMSRQYSKEEKDGSVEGGGMSRSGSYKGKNLDSRSSSMKVKDDASSKQMAASLLKKSHSTYDQTRDTRGNNVPTRHGSYKEAPLHDSMMKKKLAKKASERSNSDSLDDSAPLVYRSVSAHNLMAERKPLLHPKPPPLQKSLSTVTSAKEKALLLTNRAYLEDSSKLAQDKEKKTVVEDSSTENEVSGHPGVTDAISEVSVKDLQRGDTSERTVSSLLEGGSSQDTVHPCESVAPPSMPQKHVTYAPFRSVSINISELPGRRHQAGKKIPPEPPIRQQSLCHSLERKDVISWDAKDQTQASSQSLRKDPKDIPGLAHVCPSEMKGSVGKPEMQGVLQAKDNARQSSLAELTRLASLTAEVCPWEGMEVPTPKKKDQEVSEPDSLKSSPEKLSQSLQVPISKSTMKSLGLAIRAFNQSRLKASIRAKKDEEGSQQAIKQESSEKNETLQTVGGTLTSVEESPKQQVISGSPKKSRPKIVSKQSTICPWDEEEEASPSSNKNSLGKVFEVCPWEASKDGLTQGSTEAMPSTCADESSPDRLGRINSQQESVCPWETIDNIHTRGGEAQEEASVLHGSKDNKELSLGTEIKKSPDLSKPEQKKSRSVESHKFSSSEVEEISKSTKTQICPWEAEEFPSMPAMSVEDKEGSSKKKSTTPRTAAIKTYQEETICPWETITERITAQSQRASDIKANIKATIYPLETSGAPPEEPRKESTEDSKGVGDRKLRRPLLEETKDRQSIPQEAVCPWENASAEDSSAKPAGKTLDHNKVVLNNSISRDSKKVEVCPWETKTAEVCPWEVVSSTLEKGVGEVEEEPSKGITLKTLSPLKALEDNMRHGSVCPWEDTKAETALLKPSTKPLGPSRASSYSFQTKEAEIAPWETQEAGRDTKTAICPWKSGDTPVLKREFAKDASSVSKEEKKGIKHTALEKGGNNNRESVCPWESTEDEGVSVILKPHVSKVSSKKSDSSESLKTAVCPWETEGIEASTKADICPWDVTLVSSDKRSSKQDSAGALCGKGSIVSKPAEKASSPQGTIGSWETTDIGDPSFEPSAKSQSLSKVRPKTSNKTDSLKAEVCPWESQEVEPSVKADVCPWEGPESPAGQKIPLKGAGALESYKLIPLKQTGDSKITEKASRPRENICPWETMDTNDPSSQPSNESSGLSKSRSDTLKSEVCPWESQKVEPSTKTDVRIRNESKSSVDKRQSLKRAGAFESSKSTSLEQMAHFKSVEKMSSPQESVCPWDNVNPSELSPKPEQFKLTSRKSSSAESLKAEVCPWEVFEEGVLGDEDDSKAHQREESRTTFPITQSKAMERLSRSKEEVCPWESMELEEPSGRSAGQILSKTGSKKSGSTESLRSEICPWEFTEEKEQSTQVEVCPWAVAVAPFEKGKLKQDLTGALRRKKDQVPPGSSDSRKRGEEPSFKKIEKSKSQQESASTWESMEFNKPPAKSTRSLDLLQVGCKKSESAESVKAEVCPWEFQEVPNHAKAEIVPWEVAEGLPERRNLKNYQDTVSSDETSTKPTTRTLKTEAGGSSQHKSVSSGESVELSHSQTSKVTKSDSKKSVSVESVRAEICPWETEEEPSDKIERYPTKTAPEPFNEGSLKQNISQGKTQLSPVVIKVEGEALSKRIEKTCSNPGLVYSQKSKDKQPITSSSKSLDLSKVASVKSDSVEHPKAEICPWEIQEAGAITKAEVCPWEVVGAPPDRETSSRGEAAISKRDLKVDSKTPVETARTLEKGSSTRRAASSQESPAAVEVSLSKTSASPSSKKPDSSKSKKTEICPWEAEQVLPAKDEKPTADASVTEMSGVSVKRSQSKQESLSGHKPLCRSLPETTLPIDFSRGSSSMVEVLAKIRHDHTTAEISPCETEKDTTATRKDSSTITKTLSEVCPWEMEGSSPISTKSKSGGKSPSDKEESPCKAKSDICPWDCE